MELNAQVLGTRRCCTNAAATEFTQGKESRSGVRVADVADLTEHGGAGIHIAADAIAVLVVVRIVRASVVAVRDAVVVRINIRIAATALTWRDLS